MSHGQINENGAQFISLKKKINGCSFSHVCLAKCSFLLLTFPIMLPVEIKCQEERDKAKVNGLVTFLTVHSSLVEAV